MGPRQPPPKPPPGSNLFPPRSWIAATSLVRRPHRRHHQSGLRYDLIRPLEQRRRDRPPGGLRGLEIDNELERPRLLNREAGRLGALENLVYVGGRPPVRFGEAGSVSEKAAGLDELAREVHR